LGLVLHALGAREVLCLGPSIGAESTYVRADRWLSNWVDQSQEKAEDELLARYLGSFGPATLADFTLWLGMYTRDSKEIWSRNFKKLAYVEVDGIKSAILEQDLQELDKTKSDEPYIRLLPNFDSFLLGHKSHRNIVDESNHKMIYRSAGWISPVLLMNGRAVGVWSYVQSKSGLEVRITSFSKLPDRIVSQIKAEASELGKFLETPLVKTTIV
jgi:Winged helix DNA-binding domain